MKTFIYSELPILKLLLRHVKLSQYDDIEAKLAELTLSLLICVSVVMNRLIPLVFGLSLPINNLADGLEDFKCG